MRNTSTRVGVILLLSSIVFGLLFIAIGGGDSADEPCTETVSETQSLLGPPDAGEFISVSAGDIFDGGEGDDKAWETASAPSFRTVRENIVDPTCREDGSYDSVVYDTDGAEISRETVTIPPLPHSYTRTETPPSCKANGCVECVCCVCGESYTEVSAPALGHDFDAGRCRRCGESDPSVIIPEGASDFGGHSYYVFDGEEVGIDSFDEAADWCRSQGGHLAVIESMEENDACFRQMRLQGYGSAYFDLTDRIYEDCWRTLDDSDPGFENWRDGEPNDDGRGEDYAMFYYKFEDGTWNDGDFASGGTVNGGRCFICEWD